MFFVYALVTVFQIYFQEPVAFAQRVVGFDRKPGWTTELARMLAKTVLVLGHSLVLPLVVLREPWWMIVVGWTLGHALCGLAIGIIFQTTHLHEGTSFIEPDENGELPGSFAEHILKTTSEFSTENWLVTWIAGGLNLHVTHHLFPQVSQIHLPALSRIVRETAREYGMPYTEYTLFGAVRSHLRLLERLGRSDERDLAEVTVSDSESRARSPRLSVPSRRKGPALARSSSGRSLGSIA
jgi:linoleoyl-CoA desaturase